MFRRNIRRVAIETFYSNDVNRFAAQFGVPVSLVYAVIEQESSGLPTAVSNKGAYGLMQITQPCLTDFNNRWKTSYTLKDMFDEEKNINVGTWYMFWLYAQLKDWRTVLRAYFAGIGNVRRSADAGAEYAEAVLLKESHYV